jgi:hypothetical protein
MKNRVKHVSCLTPGECWANNLKGGTSELFFPSFAADSSVLRDVSQGRLSWLLNAQNFVAKETNFVKIWAGAEMEIVPVPILTCFFIPLIPNTL